MSQPAQFLIFYLEGQRYAIPLERVVRIVRAVEVTPLPGAPGGVLGVIDVEGQVFPVLSMRHRLALARKPVGPTDHLLFARTSRRTVALVIDHPEDVLELSATEVVGASEIMPGLDQIKGVAMLNDGVVLIHDLDRLLSLEEESALDRAMEKEVSHAN